MALHITPMLMELTYELLRASPPFNKWKLPHADDIAFRVTASTTEYGEFCFETVRKKQKHHTIGVSIVGVRSLDKLIETMAHEMCHLREFILGARSDVLHGKAFQKLADQVCARHGFKRGTF